MKVLHQPTTVAAKAIAGPPLRGAASNFGYFGGFLTSPGPFDAQGKSIGFFESGWHLDFPSRVPWWKVFVSSVDFFSVPS